VMFVPVSAVVLQPAFWYRAYKASAACEVEVLRCGMLLQWPVSAVLQHSIRPVEHVITSRRAV